MGDKALALQRYVPSGLVLYPPYVPIGHDVCNTCVTLTPYIKGPPGTLYYIKALLAGIYLRPLTRESYDRYMLLRQPSLLLGNGDTNCINHAQIRYVWEIKHSPIHNYWA